MTGVKGGRAILGAAAAFAVAPILVASTPASASAATTYSNASSIAINQATSPPTGPLWLGPSDLAIGARSLEITAGIVAQTITFTSSAPSDAVVGGSTYPAAATASSGLTVTLTIDASSASVCSIDNSGNVTFSSVGTCTIDANQAGDDTYAAAPQVQQMVSVGQGSESITFTSPAPTGATVGGATYTPTATASPSGLPVTFSIDSSSDAGACSISSGVVSFTGAGNCVIDANQDGDTNYAAAPQVQQTVSVGLNPQAINFTSSAPTDATVHGPSYTPAATGGASGNPVVFTIDTSSTGVCSIDNSGIVTFSSVGTCTIDANQSGDGTYAAAPEAQLTFMVGQGSQTITFMSSVANAVAGDSYTPAAIALPSGLPIVVTIDASSTTGACTISGGVVAFTGAGTCVIDANQAGDTDYLPAPQAQQTIAIQALSSATALVIGDTTLTATVSANGPIPTGTVTFSVNGNVVGAVQLSQGVATLSYTFAAGQTYTVTAQYAGDDAHSPSSDTLTYTAPGTTGTTPPPTGTNTSPPPGTTTTPTTPPPAPKRKLAPLKITLKLSSSRPEQHGWWTAAVTVTFTCTRAGKRVAKCPRPLRLDKSGDHVVNGHKINIDLGKPSLRIVGLNAGATYLVSAPAPGCHAQDAVSGIRSCSISEKVIGRATGEQTLRFTAKAVSGAGTVTSRSLTVSEQQLGLIGLVSSAAGIYAVNTGRTYTLEVASRTKPLYVEGAVAPQRPTGAHNWFVLNGHSDGVPLWQLSVLLPSGLNRDAYWNIGVQIGNTTRIIAIRD